MNIYVQQSIHINYIKLGGITNSSILQIGSAGIIRSSAHLYNTGGFAEPAPATLKPFTFQPTGLIEGPAVPLQAPVR